MSRNDVSGPLGPSNDIVVLYSTENPLPIPEGAVPAPRTDLMVPYDALVVACWLALFFRADPKRLYTHGRVRRYPICFLADRAIIAVDLDLLRAPSCTVPSLIGCASQINQWLLAWSESANHSPDYEPAWARTMGLDAASMCAITEGIARSIAQPDKSEIIICDSEQHRCTFYIPPHAKLRERMPARGRKRQYVEVRKVEDLPTARTPGGDKVLLLGDVNTQQASGHITLRPGAFHRNKVRVSQKISVRRQTQPPPKGKRRK